LGIIVYSNTFQNSFHLDDNNNIVRNPAIRDIGNLHGIWNFWPNRFITFFTFAINYHFNQLDVFGYHLFNLVIHLGTAILVRWLILLTFSTPAIKENKIATHSNLIASLAGLVFVTHPIQTQAVTYIIQRTTSLASMFYVLSLSLYVRSRLDVYKNNCLKTSEFLYVGSLMAAIAAMFTKEITITLPLMILLYEFCFFKQEDNINWKRLLPYLITLLIIPLTMLATKTVNLMEMRRITELPSNISPIQYLLTQFRVMVTYLRLLFLPFNQSLDYDYPIAKTLLEPSVLISLFVILFILIIAFRLFSRYRLIAFSIFWFFLTLLPESSIIPIQDVIFEHRLYLPMFGYSLFLVSIIYYIFGKRSIAGMIIILVMAVNWYALLTYTRNFDWRDEFTLWDDAVHKSPGSARAYTSRGIAYKNDGDFDRALSDFNKAIEISPIYIEAYVNRGNIYTEKGNFDKAVSDYNLAIEIDVLCVEAYYNRGRVYQIKGDLDQAISDYSRVIEIYPIYAEAFNNRAIAYFRKHELTKAGKMCIRQRRWDMKRLQALLED
jgi:tetratricopeptide (TPR) repeat protein